MHSMNHTIFSMCRVHDRSTKKHSELSALKKLDALMVSDHECSC